MNLDRVRFDPTVLIHFDLEQFRAELDAARIPVVMIRNKNKFNVAFLIRLTRFLRKHRRDVIQAYLNTPTFWARLAGKLAGIRFVLASERSGDVGHSFVRVALEGVLQHFSHLIIANSESVKLVLLRIGIPTDNIRVIYNGVNVQKVSTAANSELERLRYRFALGDKNFVVTLPGRLAAEKNHVCLVKDVESIAPFLFWEATEAVCSSSLRPSARIAVQNMLTICPTPCFATGFPTRNAFTRCAA